MSDINIGILSVGQKVVFKGFSDEDEAPDNGTLLVPGEVYEVLSIEPETEEHEANATIGVPNPDFDDSKRVSKKNDPVISFTVFGNEISLDPSVDEEQEEEAAPAPKKTTRQTKAAPKKTAKKPATKVAKKKTTKTTKPKVEFDQEELDDTANEPATKPAKTKTKEVSSDLFDEDKILILTEEEEDQDILALVRESEDIITLAQDEIHDASLTEYRLGGVLYHVKKSKDYQEFNDGEFGGKGGWARFIAEVLNMEYRKAMYLIDIYTKFSKYGIPAEEAARIGWTKAAVIAAPMNADNAEDLVRYAEEQTVTELKETVKQIRQTGQRQVVKKITFKFRLTEDAANTVRELLEQAKIAMGDHGSEDDLFEQIVTEWASEHLDVSAQQKVSRR